jgi:membrane fusion protein (multidrug efflux system)
MNQKNERRIDMTRNTSRIFAGTTLTLALLLSGCGGGEQPKKPGAGAAPPPPEVEVIVVQPAPVTLTNELPGRLQAYRTAQVRARVEGIVEKRLFTEGSDVKAGQALYQIYIGNYSSDYEAARADAALARENLERAKLLLEAKVVSRQEYEQTVAKQKQAEAALSRAKENRDNTRVPAPISGRIGRTLVTEGALVGRGEATLLATIEQTDKLYVNFTQSESDIMRLQKAVKSGALKRAESTRIELVLEDGSLYPLPGKLLFTDMAADPSTGSVTMRAEIPNPEHELLPGMFVTIRFPEALAENAISVPQRAVQMSAQGQFVMVVDAEGKVGPRPVKVGSMAGADFVIESGLQGGEQVIVNGLQKARPGSVVKPVPLPSANPAPAAVEQKQG